MTHNFGERLRQGELLVGTMVTLGYPEIGEILALAGVDWLFLDAEHSPLSPPRLQAVMQGAGREVPCLVRLADGGEANIKQALDAGAAGIIVPMVNSAELAEAIVRRAKYAPDGARGVGMGRASGYGQQAARYLQEANTQTAVVVQAEHVDAVANIDEIIAVPGVDAVLVGPFDLSASLGLMGQVTHPTVREAIGHVTQACRAAGMPLGLFGLTAEAVRPYIADGYTLIVAGLDSLLLGNSARALLAAVRGQGDGA